MEESLLQQTLELSRSGNPDIQQLARLQNKISHLARIEVLSPFPWRVAGVDLSYKNLKGYTAIVVMNPKLEILEEVYSVCKVNFPYIPSYLTFREFEAFWGAFAKLKKKPDLLLFDGQGLAHPRRCGIATHIGVILDIPSIGCAKSPLFGKWKMPAEEKGSRSPILIDEKVIGYTVRTREKVKPVFVSVGHRTTPEQAYKIIMDFTKDFRLPLPTHYAHRLCNAWRKNQEE